MLRGVLKSLLALAICLSSADSALAAPRAKPAAPPTLPSDVPLRFTAPTEANDYIRRNVMIPMRDGIRLYTVILIPKGAAHAPILLTRTPYSADARTSRSDSPRMLAVLRLADEPFAADGYIRVFQDIRGKHRSEGNYVMTRPARGPLNPTAVDHATDAWDTIDWLVRNIPQSNGRVGMIGSSYEGFTVAMALLDPHPALKVAAPENPMIDGWMGDDWFHYGAFRQKSLDYFQEQTADRGSVDDITRLGFDDYENFRRATSAGAFATAAGLDQLPWWRKVLAHPDYDAFWREQAVDRLLAQAPLKVPTMWVAALWDQEDMWGALHAYAAMEPRDAGNDMNFLALGPWRHSGVNYDGGSLGPLRFDGDTALQFRRDVLKPFFDRYLKDDAPKADIPPVLAYQTGAERWRRLTSWPAPCLKDCPGAHRTLYLEPDFGLDFTPAPAPEGAPNGAPNGAFDEYVSDPAKPVPYQPRPVRFGDSEAWRRWLVADQRFAADRTDVLTYVSAPLSAPVTIAGAPVANLVASTSGTDSDWVVKLIDVYPDEVPSRPEMGGYQLGISMDIFRGRYRDSFEHPTPIPPGKPQTYRFVMPTANHVFLPGHRIMVQIQSSWFPLYDRNPQTYVANILAAQPGDYRKATQRVYRGGPSGSSIILPVAEGK